MRDTSLSELEPWLQPRQARGDSADVAAIAAIWQFWLDAEGRITGTLSPTDADEDHAAMGFPLGEYAVGNRLIDVPGIDWSVSEHDALKTEIGARRRFRHARVKLGPACGPWRTLLVSGVPLAGRAPASGGYHCTVTDVSASVASAEDQSHYQAILAAFIGNVPSLVVVKDVEGRFLALNPLAERTYGIARGALLGRQAHEALPTEVAMECCREDECVLETETLREVRQSFPGAEGAHVFHTVKFPIFDQHRALVGTGAIGIDVTQHKRIEEGLYRRANYDSATELPNRRLMEDRLVQATAMARRTRGMTGLVIVHIGDLARMREDVGHAAATWFLTDVAKSLRGVCRESDSIGRFDESAFCIVVPHLQQADQLDIVAEKVLGTLREPRSFEGRTVLAEPSIGTALYPSDSPDAEELVRCADLAMQRARELGQGQIVRFASAVPAPVARRMRIEHHLRDVVANGELNLVDQPIIDRVSRRIVSAEALVRWHSPELGAVRPDEFIPAAEDGGAIHEIGDWVFTRACADTKLLNAAAGYPLTVAVNLSVKQLAAGDILKSVRAGLQAADLDPRRMKIEVTETALVENITLFQNVLEDLRTLGLGIALDDFGTGYSSLAYLQRFRFNQLKIDKCFVDNITSRDDDRVLVENIVRMAHGLRLQVVAEGVETQGQVELLDRIGCDRFQGYFFSKPLPLNDLLARLTDNPGRAKVA